MASIPVKLISSRDLTSTANTSNRFTAVMQAAVGLNARTENNSQVVFRSAGIFNLLSIVVVTNTSTDISTFVLRKNGADVNNIISIPAGTTGEFVDSASTDSISSGDLICYRAKTNDGAFTITEASILFTPAVRVIYTKYGTQNNFGTFNSTTYECLVDIGIGQSSSESETKTKLKINGILSNIYIFLAQNTLVNNATYNTRINGVNGTVSVTITAGVTGSFEDTSNSDNVVPEDLINKKITFAGGETGNIDVETSSVDIKTTTQRYSLLNGASVLPGNGNPSAGATVYFYVGGLCEYISTEAAAQYTIREAVDLSNLVINVVTNTNSTTGTFRLRKNGADGNLSITITANTTGFFEDTTHTDSLLTTDLINYKYVNGTGGSFSMRTISLLVSTPIIGPFPTHFNG